MRWRRHRRGGSRLTWLRLALIVIGLALVYNAWAGFGYAWLHQALMARGIFIFDQPDTPVLTGLPAAEAGLGSGEGADGSGESIASLATTWRLHIPRLELRAVMVYGTEPRHLAKGPGVYPQGAKPGDGGNLAIAAHRNAYGFWFRHLDRLAPGDDVYVRVGDARYRYEVERVFVIEPDDWSVIAPTEYDAVTLTTCHPYGSTTHRLIVRGKLVGFFHPEGDGPSGAAATLPN